MPPHGITRPLDQSSRSSENKFRLHGRTPNAAKVRCAPTKGVRDIRCGKLLLPGKVGQSSPQATRFVINRWVVQSFYRHSDEKLWMDSFVSDISLILYLKCHFCTHPSSFSQNFEMLPQNQVDEQCIAVSQVPELIINDVNFGKKNVNLFNHTSRT